MSELELRRALREIVMLYSDNDPIPEDPFEDGYDCGLRAAAKIAKAALEKRS